MHIAISMMHCYFLFFWHDLWSDASFSCTKQNVADRWTARTIIQLHIFSTLSNTVLWGCYIYPQLHTWAVLTYIMYIYICIYREYCVIQYIYLYVNAYTRTEFFLWLLSFLGCQRPSWSRWPQRLSLMIHQHPGLKAHGSCQLGMRMPIPRDGLSISSTLATFTVTMLEQQRLFLDTLSGKLLLGGLNNRLPSAPLLPMNQASPWRPQGPTKPA